MSRALATIKGKGSHLEQRRLLRLQREIHRSLEKEADRLLGEAPPAIRAYERGYRKDFARISVSSKAVRSSARLIGEIRRADVTLIADYHPFQQAQKTALRLCREAVRSGESWVLGLEMLSSRHQRELDLFQKGELSVEQFHQAVAYREDWGFPWKNYAPIFEWARTRGVRLLALNRPKELGRWPSASLRRARNAADLHARDQWAAGIITDYVEDRRKLGERKPRVLVLYGEMHLARAHLPKQIAQVSKKHLGKALSVLSVHQNNDEVYWALARAGREHQATVLQLRKDAYCVVSSTPWTRLQALINWAEGEGAEPIVDDDDFEGESGGVDYLSAMKIDARVIADFLSVPAPDFSRVSVLTVEDAGFVDGIRSTGFYSRRELRLMRDLVRRNERFFLPKAGAAYLTTPSFNGAAEVAAIHLLRTRTRSVTFFEPTLEDFHRRVLEQAFGFFGSLVINPRRKCDLEPDLRRLTRFLPKGDERDGLRIALAWLEEKQPAIEAIEERLVSPGLDLWSWQLARIIGHAIGARAYHALVTGQLTMDQLRSVFLARTDGAHRPYADRYRDLISALRGFRLAWDKAQRL